MKKRLVFVLLLLAITINGCVENTGTPTKTTITMMKAAEASQKVLDTCVQMLGAEKSKDSPKFMAMIPSDSPDYTYLMGASSEWIRTSYDINSFDCKIIYLQGDTAKVNVTYNYVLSGQENTQYVVWTMKNRNNNWVYWHGSR